MIAAWLDLPRLAEALRDARTWTSWPQLNKLTETIADLAGLEETERAWFLQQAWALNEDGQPNHTPYGGDPDA